MRLMLLTAYWSGRWTCDCEGRGSRQRHVDVYEQLAQGCQLKARGRESNPRPWDNWTIAINVFRRQIFCHRQSWVVENPIHTAKAKHETDRTVVSGLAWRAKSIVALTSS